MADSGKRLAALRLLDHFTRSGDVFFRWRSYLPLVLVPVFLAGLASVRVPYDAQRLGTLWGLLCLGLSLAGLALRVWIVGAAPPGGSERSTTNPRALRLSTTGVYSIVRHPLYVANTLVALGIAAFTRTWYVPVIVALASLLYHERICAREEEFLERQFGDEFRAWAARVPAMLPRRVRYEPAPGRFSWREVLRREFHGLLAIGACFFVLDAAHDSVVAGRLSLDPIWSGVFIATAAIYLILLGAKRAGLLG
jgi:protein-S-isoprenylcysteine O-methyltransferase Ste14